MKKLATHEQVLRFLEDGGRAKAQLMAAEMLRANPSNYRTWHLLATALAAEDEDAERGCEALASLSGAYRVAGDLPMAIVAALECAAVGGATDRLFEDAATSFSSQARELVDDWRPTPPPYPSTVEVDLDAATDPNHVEERVREALEGAVEALDLSEREIQRFFPLFSSLGPKAFVSFSRKLSVVRATEGKIIIDQGDEGNGFYIVAQGEVHVIRRQSDDAEQLLARLGPGAFFGEMAIVTSAPRAARVQAATEVILLQADMNEIVPEIERSPELGEVLGAFCRARMLENIVSASSVLRRVPEAERSGLLGRFTEVTHEPGEVIIEEGGESPGLFLLVSGEVNVSRRDEGESLTLARLGPGDYFGEISLVLRRPAVATVRSGSETLCLLLPRDAFLEAIKDHPGLLSELYETALKREEETATILAREVESADDLILV